MISNIFNYLKGRRALKRLMKQNPMLAPVIDKMITVFNYDYQELWEYAGQDNKEKILNSIWSIFNTILNSKNPFITNREFICEWVCEMAAFGVIIVPLSPEKDWTGLRSFPGVSGELKVHIKEIVEKDQDMKQFIWSAGIGSDDVPSIVDACTARFILARAHVDIADEIRKIVLDFHSDVSKDWLKPFISAQCAFNEYWYRQNLGLEDISREGENDFVGGLKYSSFLNYVLNGERYPNFVWKEEVKRMNNYEEDN